MRIIVYLLIFTMSACTEEDYIREDDPSLQIVKLYTVKKRTEPENHYLHAHVENADTADLKFEIWEEDGDAGAAESVSCRRRRLWVKAKDGWRVGVRVCAGLCGGACRVLAAGTAVAPNFRPAED